MIDESQTMGVYGMPGTFPTAIVLEAVKKFDPGEKTTEWTRSKVNDIYYWYAEGLKKGQKPWSTEDRGIAAYISEHTTFSQSDTNTFGFTILHLSRSGDVPIKFYTGIAPSTQPQISNIIPDSSQLMQYAKTIKWVSVAGVVAVVVYFSWPVLVVGRKMLTKRMT